MSPNPWLTVSSLLILPFLIFPLWRKGEPPVLSFLLFLQWLEVSLKIFHADFQHVTVEEMFKREGAFYSGTEIEHALWLSLAGLAALAMGMRCAIARMRFSKFPENETQFEISFFSTRKLFMAYLVLFGLYASSNSFVWLNPGLSQPLLALLNFKWAALFLLAYAVFQRKAGYSYLVITLLLEIVSGFLSYFAQFRGVFLVLASAFLTLHFRMRMKAVIVVLIMLSIFLFLGSVWSAIKMEYRSFLMSKEETEQSMAPVQTRSQKLFELIGSVNLQQGGETLAERIAYVDFFARVLQMVPQYVPHENGSLWRNAVMHVLTPRLLFPDKPDLESDSEITRRYTGVMVAGAEKQTSIGIGYFAESYVDFGPRLMFLPLLLLGLLQGLIYRYFVSRAKIGPIRYGVVTASLLFSGASVATACAKVLGALVMNFIITAFFIKLFGRRFINWASRRQPIRPIA